MRLFSALVPPPHAVAGLAESGLAVNVGADAGVRRVAPENWHVTLRFYGEDDPAVREPWLRDRLAGARAPRLRLAGFGRFPGVLFAAVQDAAVQDSAVQDSAVQDAAVQDAAVGGGDGTTLHDLAVRAGAGADYHPHLTVARYRGRIPLLYSGYTGEWFTPDEAVLMASTSGRYRILARFPLREPPQEP